MLSCPCSPLSVVSSFYHFCSCITNVLMDGKITQTDTCFVLRCSEQEDEQIVSFVRHNPKKWNKQTDGYQHSFPICMAGWVVVVDGPCNIRVINKGQRRGREGRVERKGRSKFFPLALLTTTTGRSPTSTTTINSLMLTNNLYLARPSATTRGGTPDVEGGRMWWAIEPSLDLLP